MGEESWLRGKDFVSRLREAEPRAEHYHPILVEVLEQQQTRIKELEEELRQVKDALALAKAFERDDVYKKFRVLSAGKR